jgi:hypothetical protein
LRLCESLKVGGKGEACFLKGISALSWGGPRKRGFQDAKRPQEGGGNFSSKLGSPKRVKAFSGAINGSQEEEGARAFLE